jgi:two-component system phosphate regulon sensor histidine kinase PhoR
VLLNLVDNAVKYAGDGGEVSVRLRRVPGAVALSIADRGSGIAADEQRRIFERFYRAENARARNVRGSGIGLALVKHIAEAHGGRVVVESPAPGARRGDPPGAAFRVYLPAPVSDNSTELADRQDRPDLEAAKS